MGIFRKKREIRQKKREFPQEKYGLARGVYGLPLQKHRSLSTNCGQRAGKGTGWDKTEAKIRIRDFLVAEHQLLNQINEGGAIYIQHHEGVFHGELLIAPQVGDCFSVAEGALRLYKHAGFLPLEQLGVSEEYHGARIVETKACLLSPALQEGQGQLGALVEEAAYRGVVLSQVCT